MRQQPPVPRFTVITLGVADIRESIAFYQALGFERKFRATGEAIAFFDTGGTVIALFPHAELARDATLPEGLRQPSSAALRWPGIAARPKKSMPCSNSRFQRALRS